MSEDAISPHQPTDQLKVRNVTCLIDAYLGDKHCYSQHSLLLSGGINYRSVCAHALSAFPVQATTETPGSGTSPGCMRGGRQPESTRLGSPGGAEAEELGPAPGPGVAPLLQGCSEGCGPRHRSRGEVGTKTRGPGWGESSLCAGKVPRSWLCAWRVIKRKTGKDLPNDLLTWETQFLLQRGLYRAGALDARGEG